MWAQKSPSVQWSVIGEKFNFLRCLQVVSHYKPGDPMSMVGPVLGTEPCSWQRCPGLCLLLAQGLRAVRSERVRPACSGSDLLTGLWGVSAYACLLRLRSPDRAVRSERVRLPAQAQISWQGCEEWARTACLLRLRSPEHVHSPGPVCGRVNSWWSGEYMDISFLDFLFNGLD